MSSSRRYPISKYHSSRTYSNLLSRIRLYCLACLVRKMCLSIQRHRHLIYAQILDLHRGSFLSAQCIFLRVDQVWLSKRWPGQGWSLSDTVPALSCVHRGRRQGFKLNDKDRPSDGELSAIAIHPIFCHTEQYWISENLHPRALMRILCGDPARPRPIWI